MADSYESEQVELNGKVIEFRKILDTQTESAESIDNFLTTIRKYTKLETLTPHLVNELIDEIIVHQPIGREKNRQVTIELRYRFIGEL